MFLYLAQIILLNGASQLKFRNQNSDKIQCADFDLDLELIKVLFIAVSSSIGNDDECKCVDFDLDLGLM